MAKQSKNKINIQQPLVEDVDSIFPAANEPTLDNIAQLAVEEMVKQNWIHQFKIWDSEKKSPDFFVNVDKDPKE